MPDAPAPTYDQHGNPVTHWTARLGYSDLEDGIVLTFDTPAGSYHGSQHLETGYGYDEVERALEDLCRLVRTAAARRLF